MAEVFKAKSYGVEGFEKIIAIKRILPTMGEDRDFIKMFIDEAKIAGQLAHANICQIFELGRIDGSHFIAMEYIWGKDLLQIQNRLRKIKQQMPIPMGCFAISKVLEGLDYAHRKRDPLGRPLEIVHRDCSPQNVLVSYEGEVKVIDFGIAKATSRNSRTMAGVLKGKFGYMSPEQVRGLPLDRRSDIFALGTMLYECLTGERLFQGETDFSTLEKVRNVDVQAPRAVNPAIPEAVEKVILKALAKDVDDRYQWCSEMLADLQQYLMGQDQVFTAKTLSSWLKETFASEIDRERAQLETYKRVGRDGLIGGLPAAEAKMNVVEHLGEAGAPEGDATTLGGPNFDDMEQAISASPEIGPMPVNGAKASSGRQPAQRHEDGDFGEEAPTEIFGDEDEAEAPPPPLPAAGRAPTSAGAGVRAGPSKPPPGPPSTTRPAEPAYPQQLMAAGGASSQPHRSTPNPQMLGGPSMAGPPQGMGPMQPNPPYSGGYPMQNAPMQNAPMHNPPMGYPPGVMPAQPMPGQAVGGTPNMMNAAQPQFDGLTPPGLSPGKTVLGVTAPIVPQYPPGYRPSLPQQPSGMYPPGYPMPQQQNPSGPYNMPPAYPGASGGHPMPPAYAPHPQPSAEAPLGRPEGRRSTLGRDIGIGVAIAALVLVGFLLVKLFVLDSSEEPQATSSSLATVHLAMTPGVTAELFIDGTKVASVNDKQDVPVEPGTRKIRLVAPNGVHCEEPITLEAGKTTTLECDLGPGSPAATGSAAGSAAGSGSAASGASGSAAGSAAGSASGSAGSAGATGSGGAGSAGSANGAAGSGSAQQPVTAPGATIKASSDTTTPTATVATSPTAPAVHTPTPPPVHHTPTTHAGDTVVKATAPVTPPPPPSPPPDTTPPPPPVAPAATQGFLQVDSKPSAKLFVDGTDTGKKTPTKLTLAPGKHKITFSIGDDKITYPVVIKAGEVQVMTKELQ
jgi:serine/threonine protein kinase